MDLLNGLEFSLLSAFKSLPCLNFAAHNSRNPHCLQVPKFSATIHVCHLIRIHALIPADQGYFVPVADVLSLGRVEVRRGRLLADFEVVIEASVNLVRVHLVNEKLTSWPL